MRYIINSPEIKILKTDKIIGVQFIQQSGKELREGNSFGF